jgi:hypothetical protein
MKIKSVLLVTAASLLGWSLVNASVTTVTNSYWSPGIYCYTPLNLVDNSGDLAMGANQTGAGTLWATILTSDTIDPTLTINNTINNDSGFAWTSYLVQVSLNTNFTISFPAIAVSNPSGWSAGISTAVHFDSGSGLWTGTIDYSGGTPVSPVTGDPNNEFDFGYKITFNGLTQYSLSEAVTPVPEPGTFALLMVGGLLLGGRAITRRR